MVFDEKAVLHLLIKASAMKFKKGLQQVEPSNHY